MTKQAPIADVKLRHASDIYPTPPSIARYGVFHALVERYNALGITEHEMRVLDIGAGPGVWGYMIRQLLRHYAHIQRKMHVTGIEIEPAFPHPPEYNTWIVNDFRNVEHDKPFDLIISNPPFSLAQEAVRYALSNLTDAGIAVFLLPINFLASRSRKRLFLMRPPIEVEVLVRRPSFYTLFAKQVNIGNNRTDAREYALFYWAGPTLRNAMLDKWGLPREERRWLTNVVDIYQTEVDDNAINVLSRRPGTAVCAIVYDNKERKKAGRPIWDIREHADTIRRFGWDFYFADEKQRTTMVAKTTIF